MKQLSLLLICLLLASGLAGCTTNEATEQATLQKIAPTDDVTFGRRQIGNLVTGRLDDVAKNLSAETLKHGDARGALLEMKKILPPGKLVDALLVGCQWKTNVNRGSRYDDLTWQLHFEQGWVLATMTVLSQDSHTSLLNFHVQTLPGSLHDINHPTLQQKGAVAGLACLVFGIGALLLSLTTAWRCYRSPLRLKWLWIAWCMVGIVGVQVDWSSGTAAFYPLTFHIPLFTTWKDYYGPLMLSLYAPVGTIHAYVHLNRLQSQSALDTVDSP